MSTMVHETRPAGRKPSQTPGTADGRMGLTKSEQLIWQALVEAGGAPIGSRALAMDALGFAFADETSDWLVRTHISHLRRKLGCAAVATVAGGNLGPKGCGTLYARGAAAVAVAS